MLRCQLSRTLLYETFLRFSVKSSCGILGNNSEWNWNVVYLKNSSPKREHEKTNLPDRLIKQNISLYMFVWFRFLIVIKKIENVSELSMFVSAFSLYFRNVRSIEVSQLNVLEYNSILSGYMLGDGHTQTTDGSLCSLSLGSCITCSMAVKCA